MTASLTESRSFQPGTTGWTAHDLDDPAVERQWANGRFEIVEGVLTTMAPAYYLGGKVLQRLIHRILTHIGDDVGSFATEVEIVIAEDRVVRADAAFLTSADEERQHRAALAAGSRNPERTRILIPPTLIIECVSPGHEMHDQRTKRRWYAEFGVPNYWLLDPFKRSLKCLVLQRGAFADDAAGSGDEQLAPSLFPRLSLPLQQIWKA